MSPSAPRNDFVWDRGNRPDSVLDQHLGAGHRSECQDFATANACAPGGGSPTGITIGKNPFTLRGYPARSPPSWHSVAHQPGSIQRYYYWYLYWYYCFLSSLCCYPSDLLIAICFHCLFFLAPITMILGCCYLLFLSTITCTAGGPAYFL